MICAVKKSTAGARLPTTAKKSTISNNYTPFFGRHHHSQMRKQQFSASLRSSHHLPKTSEHHLALFANSKGKTPASTLNVNTEHERAPPKDSSSYDYISIYIYIYICAMVKRHLYLGLTGMVILMVVRILNRHENNSYLGNHDKAQEFSPGRLTAEDSLRCLVPMGKNKLASDLFGWLTLKESEPETPQKRLSTREVKPTGCNWVGVLVF